MTLSEFMSFFVYPSKLIAYSFSFSSRHIQFSFYYVDTINYLGGEYISNKPPAVDHTKLTSGSRIVVYADKGYWKATVKDRQDGQLQIHYDGLKKGSLHFIPVSDVVGMLEEVSSEESSDENDDEEVQPSDEDDSSSDSDDEESESEDEDDDKEGSEEEEEDIDAYNPDEGEENGQQGGFDYAFDAEADEPPILPRNNDGGGGGDDDSYVDNNDVFRDALETLRDGEDDNVNVKIHANNDRNNNVTRMGRGRKLLPIATATTIVGIVTLLLCPFVGDIIGIKNPLFGSSIKTNSSLSAQLEAKEARLTHDIKEEQTKAAAEEIMIVTPENDDNGSDVEALFIYLVIHKCTDIHQSMFMFTTDVPSAHIEIQNQGKDEDTSKYEAGLPSSSPSSPSSSSQPSSHPSVQPTTTTAPSSVPSSNPTSSGVPSLMVSSKSAHIMCHNLSTHVPSTHKLLPISCYLYHSRLMCHRSALSPRVCLQLCRPQVPNLHCNLPSRRRIR